MANSGYKYYITIENNYIIHTFLKTQIIKKPRHWRGSKF